MSLNYVTLTVDIYDGQGNYPATGTATFTPSAPLTDTTDHEYIAQVPVVVSFKASGVPTVKLLATDNAGPLPAGWAWQVSFAGFTGAPSGWNFLLPYSGGASQNLADLAPVSSAVTFTAYPNVILVPAPSGATATDTPNVQAAITKLTNAGGKASLEFGDGTYQVDSNALVIRNCADFAVRGTGATVISQAPGTASKPGNTAGDLLVIADSTDFRVEGLTLDGLRDTVAPLTTLTASASSGQPSVTVASGQGTRYQVGQYLCLFGGWGTGEQAQSDGFTVGSGGGGLKVSAIAAGGGAGGGDLITFTTNLGHSYTQVSGSAVSDGFGPYAMTGAYLSPYQAAPAATVAGRSLSGEDQQCGLHLISCKRFVVSQVESRNLWESPIKLGTGFASTSLTDGCTQGTVANCTGYHAYDQGVSVWVSSQVTVTGCVLNAAGWAGISLTASDHCTVTGNQVLNSYYSTGEGSGIVTEGGTRNQIKGNIIVSPYQDGIRIDGSPLGWGLPGSTPTLSAFTEAGTAAGTSIQISSTTGLKVGGLYSILDDVRTEGVTVASIVDGTHVTFADAILFSHASGTPFSVRIAQDNVIEGNTIRGPQTGNGITCLQGVRSVIKNNLIARWAANGIVMDYGSLSGGYSGGYGTHIEGNSIGGGGGACIRATWIGSLLIRGNRLYGQSQSSNSHGIRLSGVYDSLVEGNHITELPNGNGINMGSGGPGPVACTRVTVAGNVIRRCSAPGITAVTGSILTFTGNSVASCGGHAGIDLQGVTYCVIANNQCVSNAGAGIELEDSGGTYCQYNRVTGNTCRDDGTGTSVTTGGAITQQRGIYETGTSNNNLFTANECDSNAVAQLATAGAASYAWANIISGTVTGTLPVALGGTGASTAPAAPAAFHPSSPTGTTSTTLVMMGTGSVCQYTPSGPGTVMVNVSAYVDTTTGNTGVVVGGRYGTIPGPATTVAAGSNGGEISQVASWSSPSAGVLDVASTAGYASSGTIWVATTSGVAQVTYTGIAAGQLTGCAYVSGSATGTVATGGAVTGYPQNGTPGVGTRFGSATDPEVRSSSTGAANSIGIALTDVLALTPGTAYWFDLAVDTSSGSDEAFLNNISVSIAELP